MNLPEAVTAKVPDRAGESWVFVNVNSKGQVLLAPVDRVGALAVLDKANQVRDYMRLRADEDRRAAGPADASKPPRSGVILRVDKETPFEKTHAILKACAAAGFVKYQWRVILSPHAAEGQFPLNLPAPEGSATAAIPGPIDIEPHEAYIATARATEEGKIAQIVLRSPVRNDELGPELDVFSKKLKEIREFDRIRENRRVTLTLEIDGKLRHEHVIQLIDTSNRVGFSENVRLVLLGSKEW